MVAEQTFIDLELTMCALHHLRTVVTPPSVAALDEAIAVVMTTADALSGIYGELSDEKLERLRSVSWELQVTCNALLPIEQKAGSVEARFLWAVINVMKRTQRTIDIVLRPS